FAGRGGLPPRFRDLLGRALDPDHAALGGPRHVAGELTQAGAEVDDLLAPAQGQLAQRRPVEQLVEDREPRLFLRRGPVEVTPARNAHLSGPGDRSSSKMTAQHFTFAAAREGSPDFFVRRAGPTRRSERGPSPLDD